MRLICSAEVAVESLFNELELKVVGVDTDDEGSKYDKAKANKTKMNEFNNDNSSDSVSNEISKEKVIILKSNISNLDKLDRILPEDDEKFIKQVYENKLNDNNMGDKIPDPNIYPMATNVISDESATLQIPLAELASIREVSFAFKRVVSRLYEMRNPNYARKRDSW